MLWLLTAIVILWFALASPGFRRLLAILAGVAGVGIVALLVWTQIDQTARTKEEQAAKLRIPMTNVELVDLRMGTDSSLVKLTGRVRNKDSRFALTHVELRFRVQECPETAETVQERVIKTAPHGLAREAVDRLLDAETTKAAARCETVGDHSQSIFVNVPPLQAREIDDYVSFSGIGQPRMKRTWSYEIVSVSGALPTQ